MSLSAVPFPSSRQAFNVDSPLSTRIPHPMAAELSITRHPNRLIRAASAHTPPPRTSATLRAIRQFVSVATPPSWSSPPPCPAELSLSVQPVNVALLRNVLKIAPPDPAEFPTRVQVLSVVVLPVSV